ncbi:sensor histidine kinase, partial [Streptomyces spiramenti]
MKRPDDRLLPVLPAAAQALVWPGVPLLRGEVPSGAHLLAAALAALLVAGALTLRRERPVAALAATAASIALVAGALPTGATAVLGTVGPAVALHAVAARRDGWTAVLSAATLALWQAIWMVSLHGLGERDGLDLALTAVLYAASCGWGMRGRRLRLAAAAAATRLHRTESERDRLPAVERRRMERELHDVSAHHLTAVVVSAGVAEGLRDKRPELRAEALALAVSSGREVTAALGAVPEPVDAAADSAEPYERVIALLDGIRRLGQPVVHKLVELPGGAASEAAFGIVREALTNAVRHAPGAATEVSCRPEQGGHVLVVRNGAPPEDSTSAGQLGGGRGRAFLAGRAQEVGGTVRGGPT